MANSRSRKSAPTRPGTSRDQRSKVSGTGATSRTASTAEDPAEPTEDVATTTGEATTTAKKAATARVKPKAKAAAATAADKPTTAKPTAENGAAKKSASAKKSVSAKAAAGSGKATGKRFGDGAAAGGARKTSAGGRSGGSTGSGGRGGRGGGRAAPAVRVGQPKPWGMIAATVAVVLFAGAAIGYAVYQVNTNAVPDSPGDIDGITIAEYTPGQEHVGTNVTYEESPPVGGPHDGIWADCDGAVYDQQVRSENAIHSLEHGAVWITYNPDEISDDDLTVLIGYVQNQPYIFMSPYSGLSSPISLQSWNHQLFVDAVDDPRINDFIQVLRQNPETYPEVGASCSQPAFLIDPVIEGEQSREPGGAPVITDAPTAP